MHNAKSKTENVFITGGAGFLGSTFAERLLSFPHIAKITIFDRNATNPEKSKLKVKDDRIALIAGDLKVPKTLTESMMGHDTLIHLASNADISLAEKQPTIDFEEGTLITQLAIEAARLAGISRILYASGSGVYGDCGTSRMKETDGPLLPISTYGASKLAGESMVSAYCHMFGLTGIAFRFANIVGPGQTHGIALDFVEKLLRNSNELEILGDGKQTKSYISVNDAFDAVWLAKEKSEKRDREFDVFNVASADEISVNEIARIAIEEVLPEGSCVNLKYKGKDRGWKGDVPVVRMNTDKIRSLGFAPKFSSAEAIRIAIKGILEAKKAGTKT